MTLTLPLPKSGAILGTAQTVFVLLSCQLSPVVTGPRSYCLSLASSPRLVGLE